MCVRPYVRPSVRDLGDFCEGYKRPGQGHIRLDNFSEICPRFILVPSQTEISEGWEHFWGPIFGPPF